MRMMVKSQLAGVALLAMAAGMSTGNAQQGQREGEHVTRGLDAAQHAQTTSARGKWEPSKAFPMPMEEPVGVALNGRLYLFQGLTDGGFQPMGVVYVYDPATNEWTKKNPMPMAVHHAMTAVAGGKVYVCSAASAGPERNSPGNPLTTPGNTQPIPTHGRRSRLFPPSAAPAEQPRSTARST